MLLESYWKIALEVILLWYFIYMALLFIKGTRTEQLLKGLIIIGVIFIVTQQLRLDAINWVLTRLFPISVIALVIIFQPELRQGLARLGQFGTHEANIELIGEIMKAAAELSKKRVGAIIAMEREVGLKTYMEGGIQIDGRVSKELLDSICMPLTPLHDGAIIIQAGRVTAAGCILPLSQSTTLPKALGTRHRAAVGLSEETDAVCVVVSEETGAISVAVGGRLIRNLTEEELHKVLSGLFRKPVTPKRAYRNILSRISPKVREKGN